MQRHRSEPTRHGGRPVTARRGTAGVLVALALLLGACGGDDGGGDRAGDDGAASGAEQTTTAPADASAEVAQAGGRLVMGLESDADGWVPAANRWTSGGLNIARAVYDPLAAFDADGVARPYLAEALTPSEDFTSWAITLREGVTFHNGDPLTAEAVVANLRSIQASPLLGPTFKAIESIEATGPLEVTVGMTEPWSTFPVLIAQQPGFIVHPAMITGELTDPVGTGPFVFEAWSPGASFTTLRNPEYWRTDAAGERLPYLNELEFQVITEPLSRENAVKAADIDVMQTSSAASVAAYGEDLQPGEGLYAFRSANADDEQLIALNTQIGATADIELRRAMAMALDRDQLNEALNGGFMELADTPYDEQSPWYTDPEWLPHDPEAARVIVEEIDAAGGDTDVTLTVISRVEDVELGQAIAEQWEAVGITTEIDALDVTAVTLNAVTGQFEAALFPLFNSSDPDGDYHFWDPTNIAQPGELSLAFTRYGSAQLKEAMDEARTTTDEAARAASWSRVWREVAANVPLIWLWHTQFVVVARDDVRGLESFTLPDGQPAQLVNWGSIFLTEAWLST